MMRVLFKKNSFNNRPFAVNSRTLKNRICKKFEWHKNFDADRLYFILGGLYKKFSKNYPAVFEQMGVKVGDFQN